MTGVAQDNKRSFSLRINPAKLSHLADEQKYQLLAVLGNFPDVFVEKPGLYTAVMREINVTPELKPKRLRAYRVPELLTPEIARQIQELLDLEFIRPSTSEMASPIVSHTRTVVRECCKGDDASQWENGKFDPLPRPNPLTDRHKKLRM